MSPNGVLERPHGSTQVTLSGADHERQARQLGDCAICGASLVSHFAGPGASGRFLGHHGQRPARVLSHNAAEHAARGLGGATQRVGVGR
jgi:hypothetical protein